MDRSRPGARVTKARIGRGVASLVLCASVAASHAATKASVDCGQLNDVTGGPDNNFRPPVSAVVAGSGRAYFYTAPAPECIARRVFIVPGDTVTVYKPYKGWYQVMYLNPKTGDDFEGWVQEDRLRLGAALGGNQ